MSRSWERMVERNQKKVNKTRLKSGRTVISGNSAESMVRFKGRSWMLPLIMIALGAFYMLPISGLDTGDSAFRLVTIGYIALGIVMFLIRRPFLGIGKTKLVSRRFSGDKTVYVDDINEIVVSPGYVVVQLKEKKRQWVFSKIMNMFDMPAMTKEIKQFAEHNHIPFKEQAK